jgi:hypothetical protein
MNKQQTAVEWLINEIDHHYPQINIRWKESMIDQAKEMDKKQKIAAYQQGVTDEYGDTLDFSNDTQAEEYYNETYE